MAKRKCVTKSVSMDLTTLENLNWAIKSHYENGQGLSAFMCAAINEKVASMRADNQIRGMWSSGGCD